MFYMNQGCYHIKQVASRAFESFVTRVSGYAWLIENGTAYWDFLDGLLKRFLNDLGFLLQTVGKGRMLMQALNAVETSKMLPITK